MKLVPFIAESAADAVAQIRATLGAEAVVVNVRQLPAEGLARLWQKPRIEVLAYRPEANASTDSSGNFPSARPSQFNPAAMPLRANVPAARALEMFAAANQSAPDLSIDRASGAWRISQILEQTGFLPIPMQQVVEQLHDKFGPVPPASLAEELNLTRLVLSQLWRKPQPFVDDSLRPHVLVGASGVGKTTSLCKWLAQTALVEGRQARVWQLDGASANTAESLRIYCEILGVPIERTWEVTEPEAAAVSFIDLPGVDWRRPEAIRDLGEQLKNYLAPQVHLVLNAAYDSSLLLAQLRAFSALPVEDIILTHLDEELRWGKLWNLVLGTNYSIRFLSAGQNIPGEFSVASAEKIFARQFSA